MPVNGFAQGCLSYKFLFLFIVAAAASCIVQAESSDIKFPPSPQGASEFTYPHKLIDVGNGRRINIDCRGTGSVTVVFDSGLSDWSSIWALIQPTVAAHTRACTYDRAGMGYSDPAIVPSTPENIVRDLHTLLDTAGISGPLVMVGHSLGGFNMKLYAATYPRQVVGLVLVDPSEEFGEKRTNAALRSKFGDQVIAKYRMNDQRELIKQITQYAACSDAARAGDLDSESAFYKKCTDPVRPPLGREIADARKQIQIKYAYQAAQQSELADSVYQVPANAELDTRYAALFAGSRPFGNLPLIVLSSTIVDPDQPFSDIGHDENLLLHEQTAALSTRGLHRPIPNTHHNIEVDNPQAIIDAVAEVLKTCCAVE